MRQYWLCGVLVLVTLLVYLNSFPGAFHFDDFPLLLENPRVSGPHFTYSAFLEQHAGRPLTLWTFHWNYRLFGENPFGYHVLNVLLHLLIAVELFVLLLQLFRESLLAFSSALIFAVHPLQTQAVNYIWSRSVLLMAAFGLASLILVRKRPWTALLCFQLAIWSRTEALVLLLPLLLLAPARRRSLVTVTVLNLTGFLYSLLKYSPIELGWNHSNPFRYWLLQPLAFWKYVWLMIRPSGLSLDHDLMLPSLVVAALLTFSLLALLVLALYGFGRHAVPAAGALWMILLLLPSMAIPNSDYVNESRSYLALAGFALCAGWLLCSVFENKTLPLAAPVLATLLFVPPTLSRNALWNDDLALWEDAAAKSPAKARVHYNLGAALVRRGFQERAELEFARALDLDSDHDLSYAALGYCAELRGELAGAATRYEKALQLNPGNTYAREGLMRVSHRLRAQLQPKTKELL